MHDELIKSELTEEDAFWRFVNPKKENDPEKGQFRKMKKKTSKNAEWGAKHATRMISRIEGYVKNYDGEGRDSRTSDFRGRNRPNRSEIFNFLLILIRFWSVDP